MDNELLPHISPVSRESRAINISRCHRVPGLNTDSVPQPSK